MTTSILSILESLIDHARSWILNENESWFYFSYDYDGKWALVLEPAMTKAKTLINIKNHGFDYIELGWNCSG
jgi:hypothetical protein